MTSGDNQRSWGELIKAITSIIVLMISVFTLLGIFLPAGLTQPIGTVIIGLIGTAILVWMGKLNWGEALLTWVAVSVGLIVLYLIVSRPATIVGEVIDSSGAPVKGLALVLTDANGVDHKTVSDEDGAFEINNVSEGKFTVSASGELLISGQVPSGWKRIMPQVNIGSLVYRPSPTIAATPTPTPVVPTDTPSPSPTSTHTPIPPTPTDTPSPSPTSTHTPTLPTPPEIPTVATSINVADFYYPSGWMGDGELGNATEYIQFSDGFTEECQSPPSCIKITWQPGPKGWAGIYWQYPDGNWGERPGCNLGGATSVTFWARGDQGGEIVQFEVALTGGGSRVKAGSKALSASWQPYTIQVQTQDLTNVVGAFAWIVKSGDNPNGLTFYLDDIQYVGISPEQVVCP